MVCQILWNLLLLIIASFSTTLSEKSYCDCGEMPSWPIDQSISTEVFQNWITSRQNECEKYEVFGIIINAAGVAATVLHEVHMLAESLSLNKIFRPSDKVPYLWGDVQANNCTLHLQAVDCYHMPLSYCGYEKNVNHYVSVNKSLLFPGCDQSIHICNLAQSVRRSIHWVHSQFLAYVLRHRPDIEAAILKRVEPFLGKMEETECHLHQRSSKFMIKEVGVQSKSVAECHHHHHHKRNHSTAGTLAVQFRTGNGDVLDSGRGHEPSLSRYIEAIDILAVHMLEKEGKNLSKVYLASNNPEKTYISVDYMNKHYPRTFKYFELEHIKIGNGDPYRAQRENEKLHVVTNFTNHDLHVEFYSDIYIYTHSDYFLGSSSNVYRMSAMLRQVYGFKNHTNCLLSFMEESNPLYCEHNSIMLQDYYMDQFGCKGGIMFGF